MISYRKYTYHRNRIPLLESRIAQLRKEYLETVGIEALNRLEIEIEKNRERLKNAQAIVSQYSIEDGKRIIERVHPSLESLFSLPKNQEVLERLLPIDNQD